MLNFVIFATLAANANPNEQKCKMYFTFNQNDHTKKTIPALFVFTRNSNTPSLKALCASVIHKKQITIPESLPQTFIQQIKQQKEDVMNCFRQLIQFIFTQNTQPEKLKTSLYNQPLFEHINLKSIDQLQAKVYIQQKKQYALLHLNLKRNGSELKTSVNISPITQDSSTKKELTHTWHISGQGGIILTHDYSLQNKTLDLESYDDNDLFGICQEDACLIL